MNFNIGDRKVGDEAPVLIVAELSCNHMQDFQTAMDTIAAMKEAGADAVKVQTYTPDTITIDSEREYFQIRQGTLWDGTTLYRLYRKAYTPWDWQPALKERAQDLGLIFFSSPFDKTAIDFLENMDVPAYKIASFEITDLPLIEYAASKMKPLIISTGIATFSDIEEAVKACRITGNQQIALLKCTSAYPAPFDEINLKSIPHLSNTFNAVVGVSDHTLGISVPIAAAALGAKIIEKHFILDRRFASPDAPFSLEPDEFRSMVKAVREAEMALGHASYELTDKTKRSRTFCRSLFAVSNIRKGETITVSNVRSIRPGYGLPPKYLKDILGKTVQRDIERGTPMAWEYFDGE
ncbi:MAG: pseudaminic acid synthase [Deltaproteobacteria bacterium]|nr:pseudaminic acid synthase [Deltaproteobacteria bacterium]